jgi:hypothetical protein
MMLEIKSVNAKVESLTDYISILLKAEKWLSVLVMTLNWP